MTALTEVHPPAADHGAPAARDHRGSWIPTVSMITTRMMELRKRRGLMIALVVVNIGIPSVFLVVRLLSHAIAPKSYGPAGGYDIYTNMVAGVMYVFGFIVAATLGCTAGSVDLTDGMFRHLVVTGRSRLALYLARIPAGLAIVWTMMALGFTIVCLVCVFAAPTSISYDGATVRAGLSLTGFESWAGAHPNEVICDLPYRGNNSVIANVPCGPNGPVSPGNIKGQGAPGTAVQPSQAALKAAAVEIAAQDYLGYRTIFLYPSTWLMIRSGLWLGLEATIGFIVGLGLGSLLGQRTVAVILMIVLEIILTPILSTHVIPHLLNVQRAVVGLATAHLEPAGLPLAFGGGGGGGGPNGGLRPLLVPETRTVAICVIVAWLVGWTVLGAWRMVTRDA